VPVHRLVALAFHGPKPGPSYRIHFRNGKREDSRAVNLEWRKGSGYNRGPGVIITFYLGREHFEAFERYVADQGTTRSAVVKNIMVAMLVEQGYLPGTEG
jgi:hypothetical protein